MPRPSGLGRPEIGARGAKIGVYGEPGKGKTELVMTAARNGGRMLYVLDTEGRTQYYLKDPRFTFEPLYSKRVEDALALLKYTEEEQAHGKRVIFAVDSFSSLWFEQQGVAEAAGMTSRGTAKFDSWSIAKKPLKKFYDALFTTDVDVLITMRAKPKYEVTKDSSGGAVPKDMGYDAPDIERGLMYALDLVVAMRTDDIKPGVPLKPDNFYCVVIKTSGPADNNPTPIGKRISNPTYDQLIGLRLPGSRRLVFEGDDAELIALIATAKSSTELMNWAAAHGLDVAQVRAAMVTAFGEKLVPSKQTEYCRFVYNLWKTLANGNGEENKEPDIDEEEGKATEAALAAGKTMNVELPGIDEFLDRDKA